MERMLRALAMRMIKFRAWHLDSAWKADNLERLDSG